MTSRSQPRGKILPENAGEARDIDGHTQTREPDMNTRTCPRPSSIYDQLQFASRRADTSVNARADGGGVVLLWLQAFREYSVPVFQTLVAVFFLLGERSMKQTHTICLIDNGVVGTNLSTK